ncbi:MAG TPA: hypothetical protein VK169_01475 [Saprospiraceae bacterium]|nr:hypothetical protein [Saprospiraceae bacterium]
MNKEEIFDLTKLLDLELPLTYCYFRPMKVIIISGTFVDNKLFRTTRFHVGTPIKAISKVSL